MWRNFGKERCEERTTGERMGERRERKKHDDDTRSFEFQYFIFSGYSSFIIKIPRNQKHQQRVKKNNLNSNISMDEIILINYNLLSIEKKG